MNPGDSCFDVVASYICVYVGCIACAVFGAMRCFSSSAESMLMVSSSFILTDIVYLSFGTILELSTYYNSIIDTIVKENLRILDTPHG
jgi:hypothetical protein